jgi:hypothetical protein
MAPWLKPAVLMALPSQKQTPVEMSESFKLVVYISLQDQQNSLRPKARTCLRMNLSNNCKSSCQSATRRSFSIGGNESNSGLMSIN